VKTRLANKRGMTLVELAVAAIFVGIAGVSLSIMLGQGRTIINETRHRIEILHRVQGQMERLRYVKLANSGILPISENQTFTDTLYLYTPDEPSFLIPLYGEITMTPSQQTNGSGYPAFYDVAVTYRWNDVSGSACELTLRCLY
jgi:type II secretory pathway pseudopilin PulG